MKVPLFKRLSPFILGSCFVPGGSEERREDRVSTENLSPSEIQRLLALDKVVVFLVGPKEAPENGCSRVTVEILSEMGTAYTAINVHDLSSAAYCELANLTHSADAPHIFVHQQYLGNIDLILRKFSDGSLYQAFRQGTEGIAVS